MNERPAKLCIHCKHYELPPHTSHSSTGLCLISALIYNPVNGEESRRFADMERNNTSPSACGPSAKFFIADNSDVAA